MGELGGDFLDGDFSILLSSLMYRKAFSFEREFEEMGYELLFLLMGFIVRAARLLYESSRASRLILNGYLAMKSLPGLRKCIPVSQSTGMKDREDGYYNSGNQFKEVTCMNLT